MLEEPRGDDLGAQKLDALGREALLEHQVLAIRGQRLTTPQFLAFARRFGPPEPHVVVAPSRRDFLKLVGTGAAFLAAGCARKPVEKILPYVKAPEDMQPGNPVYYASTCGECRNGCGRSAS